MAIKATIYIIKSYDGFEINVLRIGLDHKPFYGLVMVKLIRPF